MRSPVKVAAVTAALLLILVLAGCSSSSGPGSGSDLVGSGGRFRIAEYVGDGHNGTKPLPSLSGLAGGPGEEVRPQAVATGLAYNGAPLCEFVPQKSISWYYLKKTTTSPVVVVTLQPINGLDADLYLLEGKGADFFDGAKCLGYSNRTPSGSDNPLGYAPDWVSASPPTGGTSGWPFAWVAVYGYHTGTGAREYNLEVDLAPVVVKGFGKADTVGLEDSDWFCLVSTSPTPTAHVVQVIPTSGQPDLYVYQTDSKHFLAKHTGPGTRVVSFTASPGIAYYIRVFGLVGSTYTIVIA